MTFTHMVSWIKPEIYIYIYRFRISSVSFISKFALSLWQVINETVRLANIVPGIFRKALKDVKVKGKFKFLMIKWMVFD